MLTDKIYPNWMGSTQKEKICLILKKVPPKGKILDVGCGPGFLEELSPDADIVATDTNPEYLENIKTKTMQADANELPFSSNSFDTIYAIDIIHLLKPERFLKRVRTILKNNGKFVLTSFCNENNHEKKLAWLKSLIQDFHISDEFIVKAENEWDAVLVLKK